MYVHPKITNKIGVGIITYNRPHAIKRLLESIFRFTDMSNIDIFISDESTNEITKCYLNTIKDITYVHEDHRGVAANTNRVLRLLEPYTNKLLLNDDVEILKSGWHDLYSSASRLTNVQSFCFNAPNHYGDVVVNNSKVQTVNGVTIRSIKDKPQGAIISLTDLIFRHVGYFDEDFGFYGMEHVDYCERIASLQTKGYHDLNNSSEYFKIHKEVSALSSAVEHLKRAEKILEEKRLNRQTYCEPQTIVSSKKLSILICTIPSRKPMLERLLKVLTPNKDTEIIINDNPGSIGAKRNSLLRYAIGEYITFIDDDDLVTEDYISKILNAITHKPDCCSLHGIITTNGANPRPFIHSLKYKSWFEKDNVYYRYPNHLNCVKRSLALATMFPEIDHGEDANYSDRLQSLLHTEVEIKDTIYHYLYRDKK